MGLNLNLDLNKLPHFAQTAIVITVASAVIGGGILWVGKDFIKDQVQQTQDIQYVKQSVEELKNNQMVLRSTQQEIIDSQASQQAYIEDMRQKLTGDIERNQRHIIYAVEHIKDQTSEEIIDAFFLGYEDGFAYGKKKEMIP
jgi:hypothetical protein